MNAITFRDLLARVMFCNLKNFQNITSDHKSRNVRAVHVMFCLLYSQQNHLNHFSMVSRMLTFYLKRSYNNCDRKNKTKIVSVFNLKFPESAIRN